MRSNNLQKLYLLRNFNNYCHEKYFRGWLDDNKMQDSNTDQLIFDVPVSLTLYDIGYIYRLYL